MPPTYNDRPAKHSAENVALTVRTDGWPQRRTEHSRTAQEGSQRCLPRGRKFTGHYKGCERKKQTPSLRWFGKSRYNTPGNNRSLTSSALSDRMWRPVPFNGPISCRERTRGIYRLQGVAAGYGACVRRQIPALSRNDSVAIARGKNTATKTRVKVQASYQLGGLS